MYGDSFTRLAKGSGEWDKLEYNGQVVYAFAEYLTTREIKKQTGTGLEQFVADAKKKMNIVVRGSGGAEDGLPGKAGL